MELTIKVDDREGPFLVELLKKFSFVQEVKQHASTLVNGRAEALWQARGQKLFASRADFDLWLTSPNQTIQQQIPNSLLSDEQGYELINKLLGRLEHGIMA